MRRVDAIIKKALEKIVDFIDLADEEGVKVLCNNVRKPAGTADQPGWQHLVPNPNNLIAF